MRKPIVQYRFILFFAILFFSTSWLHAQEEYGSFSDHLHISGEAAGVFFDTGSEGQYPNGEFRVDEAKVFVEASIIEDIYFFSEINVLTREEPDETFDLGELYVQFENISKLWHKEQILNARAGRFDIPFGEEYLSRDAIDDPMISHSLSDLWGVDEGIELYGSYSHLQYVFAVQNGGDSIAHDYTSDKSVTGRLTYRATPQLHFSFSAMRTGDIDIHQDRFAALWFGNSLLHSLNFPTTDATTFHANLFEGDGTLQWQGTRLHLDGGRLHYEDNDVRGSNIRNANYYQLEAVQNIINNKEQPLFGALRFSRISANEGFPITGNAAIDHSSYYYSRLTDRIWRVAFGVGYRIGQHALFKAEYNIERGTRSDGSKRENEDFFGVMAAVRF